MILYLVAAFILFRILAIVFDNIDLTAWRIKRKTKYTQGLFINNFVDSKVLFTKRFSEVPSLAVITQIDSNKANALIVERMGVEITDAHRLAIYDHDADNTYLTMSVLELTDKRMIEIGHNYVEVMYTRDHYDWAVALIKILSDYKAETETVEDKNPTVVGFARNVQMN